MILDTLCCVSHGRAHTQRAVILSPSTEREAVFMVGLVARRATALDEVTWLFTSEADNLHLTRSSPSASTRWSIPKPFLLMQEDRGGQVIHLEQVVHWRIPLRLYSPTLPHALLV